MKQKLRLQFTDQRGAMRLPLDVLGFVFSYLSPQVAVTMRSVNRKLNGVVTLHNVPWTIVTDGFTGLGAIYFPILSIFSFVFPNEMFRIPPLRPARPVKGQSMNDTNFVSNAIAFRFGQSPPTKFLMECIERMQKLKRIQMPTNIGRKITEQTLDSEKFVGSLYSAQCVARLIATRHCSDITHLAVTHVPCILSVCRFPFLTSLLISFGIMNGNDSMVAVNDFISTLSDALPICMPHLQHLGLHDYLNWQTLNVDTVVSILENRPNLITLSLTGMGIELSDITKLTHPVCGLRSLAFQYDGGFDVTEVITVASSVSLLVLCIPSHHKEYLTSDVAGFEPLRVRKVSISGQFTYEAYPFRRLGAVDIVWGLTGGALFAE